MASSSAEAEYYAVVKAAAEGSGIHALAGDLGWKTKVTIYVDSSAKATTSRTGLRKVRHLEIRFVWVQEAVAKGTLEIRKAHGKVNLADVLTKPLSFSAAQASLSFLRVNFPDLSLEQELGPRGVSWFGETNGMLQ